MNSVNTPKHNDEGVSSHWTYSSFTNNQSWENQMSYHQPLLTATILTTLDKGVDIGHRNASTVTPTEVKKGNRAESKKQMQKGKMCATK